ncbi:MAG: PKD domain-containing protein [Coriobacteriia bacterium]
MPFRRVLALLLTFAMLVPPPAVADTWGRENYKIEDLATPQLVAPAGEVLTVSPTFSWLPVPGATRYEIRIETKSGDNVFRRDGLQATTFSVPGAVRFTYGSEYRFTVRAYEHSTHRASAYAPFLSFTPVRAYSNTAPTARASASPDTGFAPLAVFLDASHSTDAQGDALTFAWDVEPDGRIDSTATVVWHTYATPGEYHPTLTVTDEHGAVGTTSTAVRVLLAPPTVEAAVSPPTIVRGGVALLSWGSTGAQSVVIEPGIGPVASSGTIAIMPLFDTTYTVTARNASGEASATASVHVALPAPVASISISPERILAGGSALLSWSAVDASELTLSGVGPVPPTGSMLVSPGEDATYTLLARNETGEASASCALSVNAVPRASITADPAEGFAPLTVGFDAASSLDSDGAITIYAWDFGDGEQGTGQVASHTYVLPGTYTVTLTVTDDEGASDSATADVRVLLAPPRVTIAASADYIVSGGSILLFWGSEGADSVVLSPGIGPVSACGTRAVSPVVDTTYTVVARNAAGEVSKTLVLRAVPVSAMPAGSLGEEYLGLTPSDARVGSYYSPRFSVITGLVRDADGIPLADVKAVVRGHGEYGSVRTDSSGRFAIPVHGGGSLTLDYTRSGFISAFRDVPVGWNEVVAAPDVDLVRADTAATCVTYTGSAADVAVHVSTPVSDEDGTRSCAVAITGDTRAYARTPSGGEVALSAITLRATEFATETAMPAALPRLSAYTYCVDISADEATSVRFSKPVAIYVDDFLGFAIGEPVPVGYLDRDRGIWVPCPDGYVVALVDGNGDGAVDGVDATGDGVADDMDGDGATVDDAAGLNDPARFTPGKRSMRVVTDHFSTYDFNFAYGPPDDARAPGIPSESYVDRSDLPCEQCVGSSVDRRNRTFSEDVPIPGTEMSLHYESRRTPGGLPVFEVPLSDPSRPASVESVVVRVRVAGRELGGTLPVASGVPDAVSLTWDGRDFRGRVAASPQIAIVEVGYVYRAVYYRNRNNPWSTNNIGVNASFGGFGILPTDVAARPRYTLWSRMRVHVDPAPATPDSAPDSAERGTLARGWTLSAQHSLSPQDPGLLVKGDGGFLRPDPDLISTVAGLHVRDLAAMPSGRLFTSCADGGLWLIDPTDGSTGRLSNTYSWAVAVDPQDNLYYVSEGRVNRITTAGGWKCMAGNGQTVKTYEDGVPATSVSVSPYVLGSAANSRE